MRKVVDAVLLFFFLIISIAAPLLDTQTVIPDSYPAVLRPLHTFYTRTSGDYMFVEPPPFFVGVIWVQLVFQWPLAVASAYGIIARKAWFSTTCLMYGASLLSSMGAALAEMHLSNKARISYSKSTTPFWDLQFWLFCVDCSLIRATTILQWGKRGLENQVWCLLALKNCFFFVDFELWNCIQ